MSFSKPLRERKSKNAKRVSSNSASKVALGLALSLTGAILLFGRNDVGKIYSKSFEDEPVRIQNLSADEVKEEEIPKRIIIPSLSIDLEVKKSNIVNGYWEVFDDSAAWGSGSGLPGKAGNQVVFAHAREGLFLSLRSIEVDNQVYVLTETEWYRYEVREIKEVYPNQVEVIAPTTDETLTLYTCSGFADTKRLIVIAKRV